MIGFPPSSAGHHAAALGDGRSRAEHLMDQDRHHLSLHHHHRDERRDAHTVLETLADNLFNRPPAPVHSIPFSDPFQSIPQGLRSIHPFHSKTAWAIVRRAAQ